ncbi:thyroid receptor-interacting protein 11 isoform X2 [Danaus plexippus]|uniref:thyroid receptor-interacting protein 11 isoform X2 n=1 Tax=Danaus plexippus TaxID=13037 RepID=UPI002AB16247|nr:thyroid receptor-interacting protein 11 isoform X2 [Danaus plexippus]
MNNMNIAKLFLCVCQICQVLVSAWQFRDYNQKLSRRNGLKEEESSWYWDPPPRPANNIDNEVEKQYILQIQELQNELSALKENYAMDQKYENDEELLRLREENKNLTCSLDDLDSQHQLAMEKLLTLKKELQKNFEILKQEHEELKSSNDDYATEIKVLLHKIGQRDQEIENLKSGNPDYNTLLHKYQNLERIHSLLRENAEKFQEENQELHEEIFKLQEQVTKLEHDIEIAGKQNEASNLVSREKYEELLKEINDLKHIRDSNQVHLDEINIDDNAKGVIETLKRDISELKRKLAQCDGEVHDTKDGKVMKTDKIMQLYNRYVNFDLPVDYVGEIPSGPENIILHKIETSFKTLNAFKKEIDLLEHKLSEKKLFASHLQTQIDDLTNENEYLTSDIQHFEGELEEMKKNNDFLIAEIAALKNSSKLEPIIETHEDNLAKLETELADCNRINKTFESEIKRIENELKEVQNEKKILQESLTDMKNKYTSMLQELNDCKSQTLVVQELENEANVTQNVKFQKTISENDDLKKKLHAASSKNEQLLIDIHILENDKVLLTKQLDDLKEALVSKSNIETSTHNEMSGLEQKTIELQSNLQETLSKINELEKENKTLKEQQSSFPTDACTTDIDKVTLENNRLLGKLEETLKENTTLKGDIERLKNELSHFKYLNKCLVDENNFLKEKEKAAGEEISKLKDSINNLSRKEDEFYEVNKELLSLKDKNKHLEQNKLQLEIELASTDGKIVQLEEEFEKLISDLNDKDSIIDNLNITVNKTTNELSTLHKNLSEIESSLEIKNKEIERLQNSLQDVTQKMNNTNLSSNQSIEELKKLQIEKEEINKQMFSLQDDVNQKNTEITSLSNTLQEFEKSCADRNLMLEKRDKEIKELNQSILELSDKIKASENTIQPNDEYAKLLDEKKAVDKIVDELRYSIEVKEKNLLDERHRCDELEKTCEELKTTINNSIAEKNELINLVNLKHNESIQYHNEIQRLNHILVEQTTEFKKIIEEKDITIRHIADGCSNCEVLRTTIKEKDEIILALNQNVSDYERTKSELVNATETVKSLTKRCEDFDKNITIEKQKVKNLTAENAQLSEKEQNSSKELERLRHHLMETEESYTQELMTSEQKLNECQTRLHQVEERAKQTSTVYTSNSIRANQEVETLRNQIKLLEKQREDVQLKLSEAEDARNRSEAALTNLQVVLEQFQLDKERDIHAATEKIRNKTEEFRRANEELRNEISRLHKKLEESSAGLKAATRLGDQVETKTAQINDLKEQVRALQSTVAAAEERYYNAISNQQDKVDKNLVKNLVINYVVSSQNNLNRTQTLRILSTVLDFNQTECEKLGLMKSNTSKDSLAAEFVKFLQNESKPRAALPDMMGLGSVASSRKSSTVGPTPVFEAGHKRNPSNNSNNLLFHNLDNMDTASQVSLESDTRVIPINALDTGVNQMRNNEGAILKHVLKDM